MDNFDERALTWDNDPSRTERAKVVAAEIIKAVPDLDQKAGLEYGCGTGLLSFQLQSYLKQITLGDSSQGMIEVVKQKIKDGQFNHMTPIIIDLTKDNEIHIGLFDIIYTLLALHHIRDTEKIIAAFSHILSPSGYLCIADLDEEDGSFHGEGFTGHNGFNRNDLAKKLMKHGFEVISQDICYQNEKKLPDGTYHKYPLFLIVAKKK